ncbi:protein of unknown function [uncultured Woeseiaceae bacterium]|uniref:Cyclic pyranopterin monophosphate synthase n=1 Tax=uncultured Woeseiaceae bacterium TaxID=1983305 RepID=A0A7D9H4A4_9GAMM|nr:protein of unknown function [uncultured Woeseiaceae bacterium]
MVNDEAYMCKAVDRGMVMSRIQLVEKSGTKPGTWRHSDHEGRLGLVPTFSRT